MMNDCKRNLSAVSKKKRLYFCFNFWKKKNKENIALCESKKFGKGCFKPSGHSHSNFCPGFLINHVGMSESTE